MPEPDRIKRLLDLYCRVMADFIRTRLYQAHGAKWWDEGILGSLDTAQRAAIRELQVKHRDADRVQLLGPSHIAAIIMKNFDRLFAPKFPMGKERTRALMDTVTRMRTKLNNRQQPTEQEAQAAIQAMARLLQDAGYPREASAMQMALKR